MGVQDFVRISSTVFLAGANNGVTVATPFLVSKKFSHFFILLFYDRPAYRELFSDWNFQLLNRHCVLEGAGDYPAADTGEAAA